MINLETTKSTKPYVIAGLGKTGLACARFFARIDKPFIMMDNRAEPPSLSIFQQEFPNVPLYLNEFPLEIVLSARQIILSPGLSIDAPVWQTALEHNISIIGDIELFASYAKAPIVGITGSNAKSTVTTLVGLMAAKSGLKVGVGGNLGTPALELLTHPEPDLYVLELSSFQLELTHSLSLKVATILNISPDHMDRYVSLEDYKNAKQQIYKHAKTIVYNQDDEHTRPLYVTAENVITFTLNSPKANQFGIVTQQQKKYLALGNDRWLPVAELRIQGRHNWANALAALAIGYQLNLSREAMLATLREFGGLPHRCQWVASAGDINWYNDSKGTNVGATIAAVEGLGDITAGKIILIAGGQGKGMDFSPLRNVMTKYVKTLILFGEDASKIANALAGSTELMMVSDLSEAVTQANTLAQAGDNVLLSPACASFDMFRNYEHRGEVFTELVKKLM